MSQLQHSHPLFICQTTNITYLRARGMKLFVFFVTVLAMGRGRIISIGSCKADDFSDMEFPDDREDCADGSCISSAMYAEKRMVVPDKLVEHRQLVPRAMNAQDSYSEWRPICGCVPKPNLVNLGEGHYPRYITMAKCNPKTCTNKFYQCRYYHYRVHVLVKRGMSSILRNAEQLDVRDVEELTLPESLQANWQLFALSIPVACTAVERT